jgi:hypothetical protein
MSIARCAEDKGLKTKRLPEFLITILRNLTARNFHLPFGFIPKAAKGGKYAATA